MHPLQPALRRFWPLFLGGLALLLTACPGVSGGNNGNNSGAPQITSFTASQSNVAAGTPVTLNWVITGVPTSLSLKGSDGTNLSSISGTNTTVTPNVTTTYTLTATNSSGSDDEMTIVTVGGTGPVTPPGGSSTLSFGVSGTQDGDFQNDAGGNITAGDPRIVNVSAGNTFYAQVQYSGPAPVTNVTIFIANRSPEGLMSDLSQDTDVKGFTLKAETTGCALDGTQTSVTCVYPITVAAGTPNITALPGVSGEFAYVLRTRVSDTTGFTYDQPPRGYVTVGGSSTPPTDPNPPTNPPTDPNPPTNPPTDPNPPTNPPSDNEDPVAAFTSTQTASSAAGVTYKFSAADSKDPDGNALAYAWDFGDGTTGTGRDFTKTYTASGSYKVTLKVDDGKGGSDTETKTLEVKVGSAPTTFDLTVSQTGDGNVRPDPKGESCGQACTIYEAGTKVTLTAVPDKGSVFSGWGGACASAKAEKTCKLTVEGPTNVVATFNEAPTTPSTYTLRIAQPGNETGKYGNVQLDPKGKKCGIACTIYDAGTEVTLKAVTKNGSSFEDWGGACSPAGNSETCDLTIDSDKNVVANFTTP